MFNGARVRQDFNDAAERYDSHAALQQHVLKQLLATTTLSPDARILDVGCGTGALATALQRTDIIALDNAYRMCLQAQHSGNLPVNADMGMLPFADSSFDNVFSSLALQWSPDWQTTLSEWLRVLKPSGILAFSTFGDGTLKELAESFRIIDQYPHISGFITAGDIKSTFTVQPETITEYYPDVTSLARHLKALGARNKQREARAGLMTPGQLKKVEQHYAKNYGTEKGLPVSWNIIYARMQKP